MKPLLVSMSDEAMIEIMRTCIKEFQETIDLYDLPKLQIGNHTIEAVTFIDDASESNGNEIGQS